MRPTARWKDILDKIAFVLLAVIFFDCCAFGGGSLVKIFGLDFRMAAYILFFAVSVVLVAANFRDLLKSKMLLAVIAWGVWFMLSTIHGIRKGHSLDLILSSWIGFASFVLLPGALCVLRDKKRIKVLMKIAIIASAVLAAQTLFVLIAYQILPGKAFDELNLFILFNELGGCTAVDDSIVRIFLRSHPLMIASCAFSVYFAIYEGRKKRWLYCASIAFSLFSMMLSYTRSVYFGILVAVTVICVYYAFCVDKQTKWNFYKVIGKSFAMFLVMLLICDVLCKGMFLSYGIYRTTGIDVKTKVIRLFAIEQEVTPTTEPSETKKPEETTPPASSPTPSEQLNNLNMQSDSIRKATQDELFERIKQKPLVGHGVGAKLDVRPAGDNEYFFLDVAFKMGLIGCCLFLLPVGIMIFYCAMMIKNGKLKNCEECVIWLVSLLGIMGFSWFNPYMNGTNGIVFYCMTICTFACYMDSWKRKT